MGYGLDREEFRLVLVESDDLCVSFGAVPAREFEDVDEVRAAGLGQALQVDEPVRRPRVADSVEAVRLDVDPAVERFTLS